MASILVTAGPTHEYLDRVRFLSNGSSGRMGYALAEAALGAGHRVALVTGPTGLPPPARAEVRRVVSALQMEAAVGELVAGCDAVIAVAAVADYRPATRHDGKLPGGAAGLTVELVPNPDILAGLARRRARGEIDPVLVGFALQEGSPAEVLELGRAKLRRKQVDMLVVNHVSAMGAEDNEATLVFADGREVALPRRDKRQLAADVLRAAEDLLAARARRRGTGADGGVTE